jgi:hypothetical protein
MTQADIATIVVPLMNVVTNPRFTLWCGRGLSGAVIGLIALNVVAETLAQRGFLATPELSRAVGLLGVVCTFLYALPQPAVGAMLLATQLTV